MRCACAPAELVLYPGGDHHFFEQGKPSHRFDVVTRSLAWLERWIEVPVAREDEAANTRMRRVS
jgi:dipeptidyl aminopeptidase/acylaminoacyl peptidase